MADLRFERTEQSIQRAFLDLLKSQDYESLTVSDVIKVALITRPTFYTHYSSLFDLTEKMIMIYLKPFENFFGKAFNAKRVHNDQGKVYQSLLPEISNQLLKHQDAYRLIRKIPLGQNSFDTKLENYLLKMLEQVKTNQPNRLSIYLIPNILMADLNFVLNEQRVPTFKELNDSLNYIFNIMVG